MDSPTPDLMGVLPVDERPWYKVKHILHLNIILLVPLFTAAAFGFDGAMMNGLQTVSQWREFFGNPTKGLLGIMNAIYPLGKLLGLLPTSWMSDRYGRKAPMVVGFSLMLIGAAIQGASQNLAMFIISRFLLGFGTPFISTPGVVLITEVAYPTQRGKLTALFNTFYYAGAILAAWSTYATFKIESTWSWRIPSLLQVAIPAIQFTFLYWVPESPRWLIANGKSEQARAILVKHHAGGEENHPLVDYELQEIEMNLRMEREIKAESSVLDLVRTALNRRRTLIAVIVGLGAQWNGVSVVAYYLNLVLNTIGITDTPTQALINGLLQIFNWFAAVGAGALMVDRIGRRKLFLIATGGMCASYIVWTALSAYFNQTLDEKAGRAVVAMLFIFYFFYDIAWTPLLQAYPVEIFQYSLRIRGAAVSQSATYVGLILGQLLNPIAMANIGWKYYIVFCVLLAILLTLIYLLFPETKGRTLEQIAEVFDKTSHALTDMTDDKMKDEYVVETEEVSENLHTRDTKV